MNMKKATKKDLLKIEKEVVETFGLTKKESGPKNWYRINTEYGEYEFFFSYDSMPTIFGRFTDIKRMKMNLPPKEEGYGYYPNIYSGKLNFHGRDIFNFLFHFRVLAC